jgi:hypothetical protein
MGLAVLRSRSLSGMDAPEVTVEVHLANGLPAFTIVGLPEAEVKEAKDRVRAALQTSRFEFPSRRSTGNLAPAALPQERGRVDLPSALGLLTLHALQLCARRRQLALQPLHRLLPDPGMDDLFQLMTVVLRLIRWSKDQPPQSRSINQPRAIEHLTTEPID